MKQNKMFCLLVSAAVLLSMSGCDAFNQADCTFGNVAIGGGGYIPGIVYNPSEEGLVYCRTDIGGAYRRRKGDTKWTPITDHLGGVGGADWNLNGIESIATDPVEPNRVYLSCGTYMNSNGAILVSKDYGETWEHVEMPFPVGGNQSGRGVGERMMVNPKNNHQIFCGTRTDGLYVSNDYGASWEPVASFPVKGNYTQESNAIGVMWVEFEPTSGDVYVAAAMRDGSCLYRSTDDGASWEALPAYQAGMYPLQGEFSTNGYLYLCYSDSCGPNAGVTGGAVVRYSLADGSYEEITPDCNDGRYGGFSGISVDGSDPNTIVCGTLGFWSSKGENLYRSTDGGINWTPLFDNEGDAYVMDVSQAQWLNWGREQAQTGWWMADVEIDPFNSDAVSWGTGATLYTTQNMTALGSGTPVTVAFDAKGIEETAIFKVVSTPVQDGSPELYSIMGDLTGFAHLDVTTPPDDAHFMKEGTSVDLAAAWGNGSVAVYVTENAKEPLRYTADGGATWSAFASYPEATSGGNVAVSADGKTIMWKPGSIGSGVYFTNDFGGTWYISNGLGMNAKLFADPRDAAVFYAVCGGTLYRSDNGGISFAETGLLLSEGANIVPSAEADGFLWIQSGVSVGYSTDGGATMEYVKGVSANAIGVGATKKEGGAMVLYIMGEVGEQGGGIYCTEDHGKSWKKLSTEKDQFGNLTYSITGDATTYGRFYFATNGRGIVMGEMQH